MKHYLLALCLFLTVMTLHARAIRDEVNFTGEKAQTSYAFGMTLGYDLLETGIEIDYAAFTEGLRAAMEQNQTLLDRDEALELVQNAFESAMNRQSALLQMQEGLFLEENASLPGIYVTESGLQYEILAEGSGPSPVNTDRVQVHYEGAFIDGSIFDSSYARGEPVDFVLFEVIPGWSEGLQLMNVGSTYRLYIPSYLAYGEQGIGQIIPPYATLIFTIDLLEIVQEEEAPFANE